MLCSLGYATYAEGDESAVAKVGNTEYTDIDEAIANWTKGTTLTLLEDVTFDGPIKINTAANQTLDLSDCTMTVGNGANAIEIIATGAGDSEQTTITIKSANNAGVLDAGSKSCVYYDYSKGNANNKNDRPIIKVEGGELRGSTSAWGTAGIYVKGSAARKCATINISGGILNCTINGSGKSKLLISGGTFNYSVGSQGDSTALRLISGGTFKTLGFMTADSDNTKFWIGSKMGVSDVGVYVDDNGYLVVGGPVITDGGDKFEASTSNYGGWSNLLQYSSAKTNGLYYTSAEKAIEKNKKGDITFYSDIDADITTSGSLEIDITGSDANLTRDITLGGSDYKLTVKYDENNQFTGTVYPCSDDYIVTYVDSEPDENGVITRVYKNTKPEATVGGTKYKTLEEAVENAEAGDTIVLNQDTEIEDTITILQDTVIDANGKSIKAASTLSGPLFAVSGSAGASTFALKSTPTYTITKVEIKDAVFENLNTKHVIESTWAETTITNCVFENNTTSGATVYGHSCGIYIKDSDFIGNVANGGAIVYTGGAGHFVDLQIEGCLFKNNTSYGNGIVRPSEGSIGDWNAATDKTDADCYIKDSSFIGNTTENASNVGTVYLSYTTDVTNCIFKNNTTTTGATRKNGAAIVTGSLSGGSLIKDNAFVGNDAIGGIAATVYVDAPMTVDANYYDGAMPDVITADGTSLLSLDIPDVYMSEGGEADVTAWYETFQENPFTLSNLRTKASTIYVQFKESARGEESVKYDIVLAGDERNINRLTTADLTFVFIPTPLNNCDMEYLVESKDGVTLTKKESHRYMFNFDGITNPDESGDEITIGSVTVTGFGTFEFYVDENATTNIANATKMADNIVENFVIGGGAGKGTLVINTDMIDGDNDDTDGLIGKIDDAVAIPKRALTINIAFPNKISSGIVDQTMTVTIKGGQYEEEIKLNSLTMVDGGYTIERNLDYNTTYMITVEGAGYRTARYSVVMSQDKDVTKTLNFWNNVKSAHNAMEIEAGVSGKTTKNFLAGDLVKDNTINIWDLNAVVSFFGTASTENAKYIRYDLNRDGKIDSKDVAYVLVSWGE